MSGQGHQRTLGDENSESVLPSITDLPNATESPFDADAIDKCPGGLAPRSAAWLPVQLQTAVPAWIQQLSARGPDLERGKVSSSVLLHGFTAPRPSRGATVCQTSKPCGRCWVRLSASQSALMTETNAKFKRFLA
jgi:hypothetical protein